MSENSPLQCKCGVTAFTDIRFTGAGVMSLTCFHCHQAMQVNVPAALDPAMTPKSEPVPGTMGELHTMMTNAALDRLKNTLLKMLDAQEGEPLSEAPEPEKPVATTGYKYGGLL